jgi:lipoate-protein ligase A
MRLIELQPADALSALAAEEAVLEAVNAGAAEPAWLLWTAPARCAVLGTARPVEGDLFAARLEADDVPVWRRRSGGGTVLLGPESPAVARVERLEAPGRGSIRESYASFSKALAAALGRLGLAARFELPADRACAGRKIAGLAQRRKRTAALVSAAVLARPLAEASARYLREPASGDAPAYRAGRAHGAFMTSLAELGLADPVRQLREALRAELLRRGARDDALRPEERRRASELARELASPQWRLRF